MKALVITLPDPDIIQNLVVHPVTMDTLNLCHLEQRGSGPNEHQRSLMHAVVAQTYKRHDQRKF
ncbi:Highly reducing polyketide synthase sorA [Clarias magur]|uniref:Highly reducing polyketide synthase sorA n=1 Tax=Clarias magur TaxID=1594786 RepID=A0A8J4UDT5_CLAMG|nr:Highly reducing polyketide synthase sorA [Clarias magur]